MSVPTILLRGLPCLTLALLLGACTHDATGDAGASLEDSVQPRSRMMALAPEGKVRRERVAAASNHPRIVALPAEAASYGAVRSRDYADGYRQDIALGGARVPMASNGMTVLVRTDARDTLDERVPLVRPTEGAVRSEIGAAFPHIAMQIVDRERSNDYGPYGLALGRVGAYTRCLYMWQWIDSNRLPRDAGMVGPMSVRVHLCRAGTSFDEMAAYADHLVIGPQETVVASGDEGRVLPPSDEPLAARPMPPHRAARRHVAEHRHRRPTAVARRDSGPIYEPSDDVVAPAPASEGPRYLTSAAAPAGTARAPMPVVAAASAAPRLGGDLPPEAFAGPSAATVRSPRS